MRMNEGLDTTNEEYDGFGAAGGFSNGVGEIVNYLDFSRGCAVVHFA